MVVKSTYELYKITQEAALKQLLQTLSETQVNKSVDINKLLNAKPYEGYDGSATSSEIVSARIQS